MILGLVIGIVFVALWFVVLFDCWWLDLIVFILVFLVCVVSVCFVGWLGIPVN